jgi:ketosteroid isomerase-like protein
VVSVQSLLPTKLFDHGRLSMTPTPQALLADFLRAFSRLDLDAMLACFAPEATAFFPIEHERTRMEGREAIATAFAAVLARVRATGATSIAVEAEGLVVQQSGDTAVATFHLGGEHLGRRTVVLHRGAEGWRIVHLHASNAPLEE